jgi:hypothetical protein
MTKKRIIFSLYLFGTLLIYSCGDNRTNLNTDTNDTIIISYKISEKDLIWVNLKRYEVKEKFHPILDSIIDSFIKCYGNRENKYGFTFECHQEDECVEIEIYAVEKARYKYSRCVALFYYREYQFGYSGIFLDSFFKNTDENICYRTIRQKAIIYYPDDDVSSYWLFCYKNKIIKSLSSFHCGENWDSEEYERYAATKNAAVEKALQERSKNKKKSEL